MNWRAFLTASIVAAIAVTAHAKPPTEPFTPKWESVPTGRSFERHYPEPALQGLLEGYTLLCCTANPDRTVSCRLGFEGPSGIGFGAAALAISKDFRMTPESYAAFKSDPANFIQIPIVFRLAPPSGAQPADFIGKMTEQAKDSCRVIPIV